MHEGLNKLAAGHDVPAHGRQRANTSWNDMNCHYPNNTQPKTQIFLSVCSFSLGKSGDNDVIYLEELFPRSRENASWMGLYKYVLGFLLLLFLMHVQLPTF